MQLFYVHDPMCSWCWAYQAVLPNVIHAMQDKIPLSFVLGGLAPDTDMLMPAAMQHQISGYWHHIETTLGTRFNHHFWAQNTPRRATYPACRAVLTARGFQAEERMNRAIQEAYYLQARNPSDDQVLLALASEIGLPASQFEDDFFSHEIQQNLINEIAFARSIGARSFPSWILEYEGHYHPIPLDYRASKPTLQGIEHAIA